MENRHLIAKQVFELRVGLDAGHISQLQESFSRQYWQSVVPAFEHLFDRLVAPDQLVRVDRLELEVGRWSAEDIFSGRFTENLVSHLEAEISRALRGTGIKADMQPLRTCRFNNWLYFLEHGYLPVDVAQPDSLPEWQQQVFETLVSESSALQRFRMLVYRRPVVLERLILQHDQEFLKQLLEFLTNRTQNDLRRLVDDVVGEVVRAATELSDHIHAVGKITPSKSESIAAALFNILADLLNLQPDSQHAAELKRRITLALEKEASNPQTLAQWLIQADSWRMLLSGLARPEISSNISDRISKALGETAGLRSLVAEFSTGPTFPTRDLLRRVELAVWRILIHEVVINRQQSNTSTLMARVIRSDALLPWRGMLMRRLDATRDMKGRDEAWTRVIQAIEALTHSSLNVTGSQDNPIEVLAKREMPAAEETEKQNISDAKEADLYYVNSAGIILFHPFLQRFFQNLGLCKDGVFIDETSRQRAVCLVHHLATGEVHTPEYQLVLPKFLCGMPLNAPIDHFIEIDAAEQSESENLILAAVKHWDALGKVSPDWLREMFLRRDGKLERGETGWQLSVERKAQDILLDRLPHGWGLGIVKLPWMNDLLRIEW
ncbi:MAG: contractile injection system tape measure protein [Methylococcales bacterium]|nr:contractile injection system tape measure protein [Methylococcales bacterium]